MKRVSKELMVQHNNEEKQKHVEDSDKYLLDSRADS